MAIPDRSERNVARRIRRFVDQLAPYSPTPYMFCPIGFDFVPPIPDLVSLLDRYNEKRYPATGVWALNAGLDDYLDLVEHHRDRLPVVEFDPNPYWTGFYTARPALKARCHTLVDDLLLTEALSSLPANAADAHELPEELESVWWTAAITNHHDFITGTSPDRIVYDEQVPWLEGALQVSSAKVEALTPDVPPDVCPPDEDELPAWSQQNGRLRVQTPHYALILDGRAGGSIAWVEDLDSGARC